MKEHVKREVKRLIEYYNINCSVEEFRHGKRTPWLSLSAEPKLSEDFVREFENEVVWKYIGSYQLHYNTFSEQFLTEFINKLGPDNIVKRGKMSRRRVEEIEFLNRTPASRFELMDI